MTGNVLSLAHTALRHHKHFFSPVRPSGQFSTPLMEIVEITRMHLRLTWWMNSGSNQQLPIMAHTVHRDGVLLSPLSVPTRVLLV